MSPRSFDDATRDIVSGADERRHDRSVSHLTIASRSSNISRISDLFLLQLCGNGILLLLDPRMDEWKDLYVAVGITEEAVQKVARLSKS